MAWTATKAVDSDIIQIVSDATPADLNPVTVTLTLLHTKQTVL